MIITKAPFRISFFGGGTDYPTWYKDNPGAVLATSIDKYCYFICRYLPPFFEHKHRIVWSQIELPQTVQEIHHPSVKEVLKFLSIDQGVEIHYAGDLPARTGVGSSSSFTVGLLHALYSLKEIKPSKMQLAEDAIHIEQDLIGENVGSQDQVTAAFGGFNRIDFSSNGIKVSPVGVTQERIEELENNLGLFFTGIPRTASLIAEEVLKAVPKKRWELEQMYGLVREAVEVLRGTGSILGLGPLLHETWLLKKSLAESVSPEYVDYLYDKALEAGAVGGKLLGAGGGGFILFLAEPEVQVSIQKKLKLLRVPFRFEVGGSQVIYEGS